MLIKRKISQKRLCLILDLIVLLLLAGFVGYMVMRSPRLHYPVDRAVYPVKGIDISAHNGDIDFVRAVADSVTFVIIKATEGTDFCDAKFKINYDAAKKAGLKVGAYHFFRFDTPGDVQARHFLASINGNQFDMPLIVDVEKWGNPSNYESDDVKTNLKSMLDVIRSTGYPVMIYTNRQGYTNFIKGDFDDIPLWICSLSRPPQDGIWTLWQHSHQDSVDGIHGPVDANTYCGDFRQFWEWVNEYTVSTPYLKDRQ